MHERQFLRALCVQNALVERAREPEPALRGSASPLVRLSCDTLVPHRCEANSMTSASAVQRRPATRARDSGASGGWVVSASPVPTLGVSRTVPSLGSRNPNSIPGCAISDRLLRASSWMSDQTSISARSTKSISSDKTSPSQIGATNSSPPVLSREDGDAATNDGHELLRKGCPPRSQSSTRAPVHIDAAAGCCEAAERRETLRMSITCLRRPSPRKSPSKQRRRLSRSPPPEEMGQVVSSYSPAMHSHVFAF